jgi:hypothetical protein
VYGWLKSLQLENGLLESTENSNFVSLYDNALAAIVFSCKGDFARAEKIFDFFNERLAGELERSPGGFGQFRDRQGIPRDGLPHRWLGDNAWLLIAIHNYQNLAGNKKYGALAAGIEAWIRSLQDKEDGGLWGGFDIHGNRIHKVTEGIIDAYNAVEGFDAFHSGILGYLKSACWDPGDKVFLAWKGHPKYQYALDLYSWGYSGFKDMPLSLLAQAERLRTKKIAGKNNKEITGFCFDLDLDTIWLEGTGQMAAAYRSAGMDSEAQYYIQELEKMLVPGSKDVHVSGIPYATNRTTGYGGGQLWDGVDVKPCISSSSWYLLGKWGYDPLKLGRDKVSPVKDMFWKE